MWRLDAREDGKLAPALPSVGFRCSVWDLNAVPRQRGWRSEACGQTVRNSKNPASAIDRAKHWLRTMPRIFKFSIPIRREFFAGMVLALRVASRRTLEMRAWRHARRRPGAALQEPRFFLDSARPTHRTAEAPRRVGRAIFLPVLSVAKMAMAACQAVSKPASPHSVGSA